MDFRDDLEVDILLFGENEALNNITVDMIKEDNIECCVCLNYHWGVKLPNCNHFICPKCYYKIYNGFISNHFLSENIEPIYPETPVYPYINKDTNKQIFYGITEDDKYLEWFIDENEDLYNSIKINSVFVENINDNLKCWFENNELIKQYERNLIQYKNDMEQYNIDIEKYNYMYKEEKEYNAQQKCPLCRR